MIELIFKLLLFYILSLAYFYSVTGYGKLISNKNSNFFELQLDGTIVLLLIGYIFYLSIGINGLLNCIIVFFGFILFFFHKKKNVIVKFNYILLLFILLFSVLLISKTHEDFNSYHLFSISELFNNSLRIGISKLNMYYMHSSHLTLNQALTVFPYLNFKIIHLPIFIIYISVLGYFLKVAFSNNFRTNELFFSIFSIFILLVKFNRLSEFGYDYISQFILLVIFHKIYFLNFNKYELRKSILYFFLCVLIKPVSLLFSPILLFIFYKNGFKFFKKISFSKYILICLLLLTLISSSFTKTGCIFYPINSSCFSKEQIFWSEKGSLKSYSRIVELWAKSYDAQIKSKNKKIEDANLYLQKFNWLKFWIEHHFFYKIFEFLLIALTTILLIYFYFVKLKENVDEQHKDKNVMLFLSTLSILFWLNTVPQFRFGFTSILIFMFIFFSIFLNLNINFNKKKIIHILIFGLLILNIKNFSRINNEFSRNDFYKFTNFPFYNEKKIINDYSKLKKSKFFHIEILK